MSEENKEETKEVFESFLVDEVEYKTLLTKKFRNRKKYQPVSPGLVVAVIPGTIVKINTRKGRKVQEDDSLLILEAMKMQNIITSPIDGKVTKVNIKKGQMVHKGYVMIEIEAAG